MAFVKEIDALLPQTQCGECGYLGCLPYAEALALGAEKINKCPPGGIATLKALGTLLKVDPLPYLNEADANTRPPSLAFIHEEECIGCTKCIKACPVDAIIGSGKLMHAVIAPECTGCGLCVAPCPVDCIEMVPLQVATYDKDLARKRFNEKQTRLNREQHAKQHINAEKRHVDLKEINIPPNISEKQNYIQQALARVKAKKKHE